MWSTLQSVPLNHDEHVGMCDLHLVYLGFGAFLRLVPRLALDTKGYELPILGHVVGEDPKTHIELLKKAIKEEKLDEPKSNAATAAAGSTQQLPRVERELNMPSTKSLDSPSISSNQPQQISEKLQAVCKPLCISLTRLRKSEIMEYQCTNIKAKPNINLFIIYICTEQLQFTYLYSYLHKHIYNRILLSLHGCSPWGCRTSM